GRQLFGCQFEIEDVEVFGDAGRLDRFGDDLPALLKTPAQHDLCRRFAVLPRNLEDRGVLERALPNSACAIERDAADRCPGLGNDAEPPVLLLQGALLEIGMYLDLVDGGNHIDLPHKTL